MVGNQITYLDIDRLHPHPQNPRKDLGDLSELANSIAAVGVLQNLTVVPLIDKPDGQHTEDYTVIIGHRRLEAAKIAGLNEVPCVIAEGMTRKEQIGMMLLENIQRSDLTLYEQAESFQLMLDIGDTVETVAKETGFSKSTIYSRLKLLDYDRETFQESVARGGTLEDYAKLDKIKSQEKRNEVLASIGTSNFNWNLKSALDSEEKTARKAENIAKLETFATKIEPSKRSGYQVVKYIYGSDVVEIPEDISEREYFYFDDTYSLTLYTCLIGEEAAAKSAAKAAEEEKRQKRDARKNELDEVARQMYQLRYNFIKSYTKTNAKKHLAVIAEMLIWALDTRGYGDYDTDDLLEICDIENDELNEGALAELRKAAPERLTLMTAYIAFRDSYDKSCHGWSGDYVENEYLIHLYSYLEQLGYEVSGDERAYIDGTHELFEDEPEDND